ncbi:phage tail assembly chaperone [Brevibacillus thermoruber]|jgi:hypothetical protein|uniref:phage tail assembly chaperone n=1 Tax=Brevibacillus thermoruber TaxID=33942 RepID=UPI00404133C3
MANKRDTKLTLADLIAKKAEKEAQANRSEEMYIESLGGSITVHTPKKSVVFKSIDMTGDSVEDNMYANAYLVYESVPMFQDKSLHEAYEVKEPVQIVEKLLLPVEIKEVAEKAMELAGFTKKDPIESVKK